MLLLYERSQPVKDNRLFPYHRPTALVNHRFGKRQKILVRRNVCLYRKTRTSVYLSSGFILKAWRLESEGFHDSRTPKPPELISVKDIKFTQEEIYPLLTHHVNRRQE